MLGNQTKDQGQGQDQDQDQDEHKRWMEIFAAVEGLNAMKRKHNLMLDQQILDATIAFAKRDRPPEEYLEAWEKFIGSHLRLIDLRVEQRKAEANKC